MQKISRRWWGAIALGAVLDFGLTACSTRKGNEMFNWVEGTKPLEERQTIEDYQVTVEVQLGRFVEQLGVESGGTTLLSPSEISSRSNGGYMMFSALIAFKQPVSYIRAQELAEQLFFAVGLNSITDLGDNIFFHDPPNGGFVSLKDNQERGVAIYAASGSRPATQTDPRATRVVPEWETALPLDPSVDPTSTWTPAPPPPPSPGAESTSPSPGSEKRT